jgi:N-acyl-D-amino-acid deacylase
MNFDIVIEGGTVLDGMGSPAKSVDVGIVGDRIGALGDLRNAERTETINARGKTVAPGLVDIHGHSDFSLIAGPAGTTKIEQGVTTEILGNCGMSAAPYDADAWILGLSTAHAVDRLCGRTWSDIASYLDLLEDQPLAYNVGALVGLGSLLRASRGDDADPGRLASATSVAMEAGAFGLSMGLYYEPDSAATTQQLSATAEAVSAGDGLLAVHLRDEGGFGVGLFAAVDEALGLARQVGVRLQISHLKAIGPTGWLELDPSLERIEAEIGDGRDIGADMYPYEATETSLAKALRIGMDPLDGGDGQVDTMIRLRGGSDRMIVSQSAGDPAAVGASLAVIADRAGVTPSAVARRLVASGEATVLSFSLRREDVDKIMRRPWVAIASDGAALTPDVAASVGRPHPRGAGTFPRVLGRFVREAGVLPLPEAIRRMTSLPASRVGLIDRGCINTGAYADILVFDASRVIDGADFDNPCGRPLGIDAVLVNGRVAVSAGSQTDERLGRVLRHETK